MPVKPSEYFYEPLWMMGVILTNVSIMGYLFSAYFARLSFLIKTFFSFRALSETAKNEYSLSQPASVLLSINFLLVSALFVMQAIHFNKLFFFQFSFMSFLLFCFIIAAGFLLKTIMLNLLGIVFRKKQITDNYLHLIYLSAHTTGMFLIPLVIIVAYSNINSLYVILFGEGIVTLAVLFTAWKAIITALFKDGAKPFYIFLYLCAFEILPLLVCVRLLEKFAYSS